ncbi:MAG: hypothetical protein LBC53_04340 [Spirochaetaceae bacterium]|jgi:hypothetical protein|nr:hypothetical protein [Spirochaetaceae bacterium]
MNKCFLFLAGAVCLTAAFSLCVIGCGDILPPLYGDKDGGHEENENGGDKDNNEEDGGNQGGSGGGSDGGSGKFVWYVSSKGSASNSGTEVQSPLPSVNSALDKIKKIYRGGSWPAGESAVIVIRGVITASGYLGANESMVEITGAGAYPPIILKGDPVDGGVLNAGRKNGEDGRVLFITNNKVTLAEKLTLTGGNQLWGGAVCVGTNGAESEGEFIMAGGEISGNKGASGGAVIIYKGSMTMTGGVIKENRNNYNNNPGSGGGVYVNDYTSFTMTGGIIELNGGDDKAEKGGGIFINGRGAVYMSGGEIRLNTSVQQGGGVYIATLGVFNMSGGLITGNTSGEGGGVYASPYGSGGKFDKTGGEVSGNNPE